MRGFVKRPKAGASLAARLRATATSGLAVRIAHPVGGYFSWLKSQGYTTHQHRQNGHFIAWCTKDKKA